MSKYLFGFTEKTTEPADSELLVGGTGTASDYTFRWSNLALWIKSKLFGTSTVWTSDNDGVGSGLDADTLQNETPSTLRDRALHTGDAPGVNISVDTNLLNDKTITNVQLLAQKVDSNPASYIPQGSITAAADFPLIGSVQAGWLYTIEANVTDNDVTKTNTGQSFLAGVSIVWAASGEWLDLGSNYVNADQKAKLDADSGNVSLVNTPSNFKPVIDYVAETLDLGYDPVLIVGAKSYALNSIWYSNPEKYRAISLHNTSSSAIKLYFNTKSKDFTILGYSVTPSYDNILIGAFRRNNGVLTGNLAFEIERSDKVGVSLVVDFDGSLPHVDHGLKTLDLGDDPILIVGDKTYAFKSIWPANPEKYRNINLDVAGSSTAKLIFNTVTNEFRSVAFNVVPFQTEALIGGIREWKNRLLYNFPFETTDSISNAKNLENILIKPSMGAIAHRGVTMGYAPENSLDAFKLAGRMGFKKCETDVSVTSDGEFVLMHDSTINRTCRNAADYTPIESSIDTNSITLADLRANYILESDTVRFRQPVPTMKEFLIVCRDNGLHPIMELKSYINSINLPALMDEATEILGAENYSLTGLSVGLLDVAGVYDNRVKLYYIGDLSAAQIQAKGNAVLYQNYPDITAQKVKDFKNLGIGIGGWTVPNSEYNNMLKLGLDFIATDTIAPSVSGTPVFADYSDGTFDNYETTGNIVDGMIELTAGQTVKLRYLTPHSKLGSFYLSIDSEGPLSIGAENLYDSVNNTAFDNYTAQCMLYDEGFSMTITATGEAKIKEINLQVTKY